VRGAPALFLSASAQQSAYWANQLGFGPREWRHLGRVHDVLGLRPDSPVYLVGTWSPALQEVLDELEARGVECVLAQEMVPRPALR
jgi:hypothetical protein